MRLLVRVAAARSPFYRRWFAAAQVDPASVRTLDDLRELPLVTRADLVRAPADFAVYPLQTMWESRSSGTSGQPVTVFRTPGSSAYELAALQRQWRWFGLPRGARRVVLRGSDFAADGREAITKPVSGNNQLLVSSFHLTSARLPEILQVVREFRPHAVEGWPSSIALLAALMREAGETLPVPAIITSSETMSLGQQALIRAAFAGPIVDHYGQTERVAQAGTCEAGSFHIFPDYGIVELLAVDGRPGTSEIVGTALHNWGFPLLRYRTGDEVGPSPTERCPCGRAFPRLGTVDGRTEDSFVAADGRVIPLPSTVVDDLEGVLEAQIAQLAQGRFEIRMAPAEGCDVDAEKARALRNVERLIGPGQQVGFRTYERIPRTPAGKLRSAIVVGRRRSAGLDAG